jgi:hypothetical protein
VHSSSTDGRNITTAFAKQAAAAHYGKSPAALSSIAPLVMKVTERKLWHKELTAEEPYQLPPGFSNRQLASG